MAQDGDGPEGKLQQTRRAGFWATMRAVLWSFIGIRKRNGYQRDAGSLDPKAVVVAGVLVAVVRLVLRASQQGGV